MDSGRSSKGKFGHFTHSTESPAWAFLHSRALIWVSATILLLSLPTSQAAAQQDAQIDIFGGDIFDLLANPQGIEIEKILTFSNQSYHPLSFQIDHNENIWILEEIRETPSDKVAPNKASPNRLPTGSWYRLVTYEDRNGNGDYESSAVFTQWRASSTAKNPPCFLVSSDGVYVGTESKLCLLRDIDHDGKADLKRNIISKENWDGKNLPLNITAISKGPTGWLYLIVYEPGQINKPDPVSAIFKCRPDGSDIQEMATGFNDPGDLVFDKWGHLFTVDRDTNSPGETRWIYVVEGAHYGNSSRRFDLPSANNPLAAKEHLRNQFAAKYTPAYVFPPVANIQTPLNRIVYNPYQPSGQDSKHRFVGCEFGETMNGMIGFAQRPAEISFRITELFQWKNDFKIKDLAFDDKGGLILLHSRSVTDDNHENALYRIVPAHLKFAPEFQQASSILRSSLGNRTTSALLRLLRHRDLRVRTKAQETLVARGLSTLNPLMALARNPQAAIARVHAIWAAEQLLKSSLKLVKGNSIQSWIADVIKDPSPEVRTQAVALAGRLGTPSLHGIIINCLKDPSLQVRQTAAIAIGHQKIEGAREPLLEFIADETHRQPILQHAGVMAMTGAFSEDDLSNLCAHSNQLIRLSSTLALRKKLSPKIANFLRDESPTIVFESANAIHELNLKEALPELAGLHGARTELAAKFGATQILNEGYDVKSLFYLVYLANYETGRPENLKALMEAASDSTLPTEIKEACINWVIAWMNPKDLQLETSQSAQPWRNASESSTKVLKEFAEDWFSSSNPRQKEIILYFAQEYGWKEFHPSMISIFRDYQAKPALRAEALRTLFEWESGQFESLLNEALISNSALLRNEAVLIQAKLNPEDEVAKWTYQLKHGSIQIQQQALKSLGSVPDRRADAVLLHWLELASQNSIPPELNHALKQAAQQRTAPALKKALDKWIKIQSEKAQQ